MNNHFFLICGLCLWVACASGVNANATSPVAQKQPVETKTSIAAKKQKAPPKNSKKKVSPVKNITPSESKQTKPLTDSPQVAPPKVDASSKQKIVRF